MSPPALDPVVVHVLRLSLALLLAAALRHKLRDPARFREVLVGYALLPARLVRPAAAGVTAAEAALAVGLLVGPWAGAAGRGAAALFALYGAAIAVNLARGRRDLDCGCLGPAGARVGLHGGLVLRNAVLVGAALAAAAPPAARALGGLDLFTIGAATGAALLLGAAGGELLARGPALRELAAR